MARCCSGPSLPCLLPCTYTPTYILHNASLHLHESTLRTSLVPKGLALDSGAPGGLEGGGIMSRSAALAPFSPSSLPDVAAPRPTAVPDPFLQVPIVISSYKGSVAVRPCYCWWGLVEVFLGRGQSKLMARSIAGSDKHNTIIYINR